MPWYAAHAVLYVRYKSGTQSEYPVWENVYLVEARDPNSAVAIAEKLGRDAAGDSDGTFTWSGEPSEWVFAGVRKLISVAHCGVEDLPSTGDEITYSEFKLASLEAVEKLAAGAEVSVDYIM